MRSAKRKRRRSSPRSVEADLDAAEALTAKITERKRVLFILSTQGGKILASGTGTAADGIIAWPAAVNAISGFTGYKQLSDEAIISARPDVILMMDRAGKQHPPRPNFSPIRRSPRRRPARPSD